ncbi:hypothetical protein DFH08DRAFT_1084272 [Mycena albidolilacea]|uniref:Uncharacterized protein n=1 Tax=Mycena albidolilacea TaxID=1033008 RepID=A0AAD6ZLP3_9AGAR|nr:hypothetical protein DFH08DRAFT_1084272 [Mycena albidolilacea]
MVMATSTARCTMSASKSSRHLSRAISSLPLHPPPPRVRCTLRLALLCGPLSTGLSCSWHLPRCWCPRPTVAPNGLRSGMHSRISFAVPWLLLAITGTWAGKRSGPIKLQWSKMKMSRATMHSRPSLTPMTT